MDQGARHDFKERVRQATDIVGLVGRYVPLKRSGKTHKARCPFHSERTPSFHVDPARQSWRCFGACDEGGDVFDFFMKIEGIDFREALSRLAESAGLPVPQWRGSAGSGREKKKEEEDYLRLQRGAAKFFRKGYLGAAGVAAREYCVGRGVSGETSPDFELGWAPDSYDTLIEYFRGHRVSDERLVRAGLVGERASGGIYDRFRGRLIFPIRDDRGRTVGFGGRVLGEAPGGAKYLNSPAHRFFEKRRLLYGLDRAKAAIRDSGCAVIAEGYLDVLGAHQAGFANVVATLGTALTAGHMSLLLRFCERVVLAFDGDEAGRGAAEKASGICLAEGMRGRVMLLGEGEDVADLCLRGRGAEFERLQEGAVGVFDFLLGRLAEGYELEEAEGKAAAARSIMERVSAVRDGVARAEYRRRAADYLAVPERELEAYLRPPAPAPGSEAGDGGPGRRETRLERAERDLLPFLLAGGPYLELVLAAKVAGAPLEERLTDPAVREVLEHLKVGGPTADAAGALLGRLEAGPVKTMVVDMASREVGGYRIPPRRNFEKALSGLRRMYVQAELDELDSRLRKALKEGRPEDYEPLMARHRELSLEMR